MIEKHFPHFGWLSLEAALLAPSTIENYRDWVESGMAGEMDYLRKHLPYKENPKKLLSGAQSIIMVATSYVPHPRPKELPSLPIARYALGEDYHFWFRRQIENLILDLKKVNPTHEFLSFTDSSPVLEREIAWKAGLGWIGKNTCVIDEKRGSFFLLGGILTTLPAPETPMKLPPDRCGTCTRCLDACPTGAIVAPRKLDARLCISYLTIEAKGVPDESLRKKIDWYFGCDICQSVCPWNRKTQNDSPEIERQILIQDLRKILTASNREIERMFQGTPLLRTRPVGHKRNAILLSVNKNLKELRPEISAIQNDALTELIGWALKQLE